MTRVVLMAWFGGKTLGTYEAPCLPVPKIGEDVLVRPGKVRRVMNVTYDYRTLPKDGLINVTVELDEEKKA